MIKTKIKIGHDCQILGKNIKKGNYFYIKGKNRSLLKTKSCYISVPTELLKRISSEI